MKFAVATLLLLVATADAVAIKGRQSEAPKLTASKRLSEAVVSFFSHDSGSKTMAQLLSDARSNKATPASPWKHVAFPQVAQHKEPVLPIGEGAYQSGEAVAQRTTDHRKHCEDAETHDPETFNDCYSSGGDFVDGHVVSAPVHHDHSGAAPRTVSIAAFSAMVTAMVLCSQ